MTNFANTSEQLAALRELDEVLQHEGISYWLFGGWAVDFHAGRVTRLHADVDIAVWSDDLARVTALLAESGWVHRPDPDEDGYTAYERGAVRLDLAFLALDETGHVYTPVRDGRGEWPEGTFGDAAAELHGIRARVVGRDALMAEKSIDRGDAVTAAKDRADVASLTHRRMGETR
jgi:hypothetical protein